MCPLNISFSLSLLEKEYTFPLNNPAIISLFPPIIVRSSFQFFISVSNTLQEGNSVETKVFIFSEL